MVGTTIGRVALPVIPIGNGADLIVSLCSDSSGVPGNIITQTRIPANWITQLSAASCIDVPGNPVGPVINPSGNPLAVAQFNSFRMGGVLTAAWPYPSVNNAGGAAAPASTYYGSYLIFVGGVDSNHNALTSVFTAAYDEAGNLSPAVPQSALPSTADGSGKVIVGVDSVDGSPVLVQAGGGTTFLGSTVATVYTAQLDPTTGVVSSWSGQAALPYTVQNQGMATYNGYVYVIGGATTGTGTISTVSYGLIQNTQISSWATANPLPQAIDLPYCAVSNGFLFVMGGRNSSSAALSTCYYAAINANGSLGAWQAGPSFYGSGFNLDSTSFGNQYGIITEVSNVNYMAVTPNGPDITWNNDTLGTGLFTGYFEISPVSYRVYAAGTFGSYGTYGMLLLPNISVPLPATGLTNGATYHVLMQSPTDDGNNYLNFTHETGTVFPGNPKLLFRSKGSPNWASSTTSVTMTVYDGSATGPMWHLWEDSGARVVTVVRSTTPNQNVIGVLDATVQPGPVLNINPTFTIAVAPWVAHGSAVAQSNAFTHGELPFSAKVTPDGVSALSYIESDQVSVMNGHSYTVSAWLYSPTGYASVALSINWYSAGVYNTTTSTGASAIPAGVWTQYQLANSAVPAGLTNPTATIAPTESGTAPVTAIFYVSGATIQDTSGPMLSTVAQVNYTGTWPSTTAWPPVGVNQLA